MSDKPSERQLSLLPQAELAKCEALPTRPMPWITDAAGRCMACKRRHLTKDAAKLCIVKQINRARARLWGLEKLFQACDLADETFSDNDARQRRRGSSA